MVSFFEKEQWGEIGMRPRHRKKERQPSPIQNQTKSVRIEKEKKGRYSRKEYRAMYRREVLRRIITGGRKIVFLPYKRIIRKTRELQKISPPLPKSYQNLYSYEQNQKVHRCCMQRLTTMVTRAETYTLFRKHIRDIIGMFSWNHKRPDAEWMQLWLEWKTCTHFGAILNQKLGHKTLLIEHIFHASWYQLFLEILSLQPRVTAPSDMRRPWLPTFWYTSLFITILVWNGIDSPTTHLLALAMTFGEPSREPALLYPYLPSSYALKKR
jgi:hypothetical protein